MYDIQKKKKKLDNKHVKFYNRNLRLRIKKQHRFSKHSFLWKHLSPLLVELLGQVLKPFEIELKKYFRDFFLVF